MKIAANNAELWLFPNFIKLGQSQALFHYLQSTVAWRQDQLTMYGKLIDIPRLQAWFGDAEASYSYSGLTLKPQPWLPALAKLKTTLSEQCQAVLAESGHASQLNFNSALANLYRDNQDGVAWHSDDEPELGANPVIASVSLGASREFNMKHKVSGEKLTIPLTSGSLLLMAGETQRYWQHAILCSKKGSAPRINLTFRQIFSLK